jgi:hypothetical protein
MVKIGTTHCVLFAAIVAFSSACGYRSLASSASAEKTTISKVVVPIAKNETSFPSVAAPFTAEVRARLAALGIQVADEGTDAPVLSLLIASIHDETGMTVRRGDALAPADAAWTIEVMVSLDTADGERIIPPTHLTGGGRSLAPGAVAGEEYLGARTQGEIMDELAARVAAMVAMLR